MGPALASADFSVYVTWPTPRQGQPPTPAGAVTWPTMTARRVVGTMARALAPTLMLCPARHRQRRDGVGRRSLSVRRPEPSRCRRSCILLAVARPLRLLNRTTPLCSIPLNGFQRCNRGYMVAEPSSGTSVVMLRSTGTSNSSADKPQPHQPLAGGGFPFQPCSAEINGPVLP
jgi:hypothetical protein